MPAEPQEVAVEDMTLQAVLDALADPVRRDIVCQLYAADSPVRCGGFGMTVSKSTGTHHFRVLRESGLIRQYYVGTSRLNTLRLEELERAFPGLIPAIAAAELTSRSAVPAGASGRSGPG